MVIFLIAVIVLLTGIIVYLNIQFYNEKRQFRARIESLRKVIVEITNIQTEQTGKLQLSDTLDEKLKTDNTKLSDAVFGLNHEMFKILSENNLLRK